MYNPWSLSPTPRYLLLWLTTVWQRLVDELPRVIPVGVSQRQTRTLILPRSGTRVRVGLTSLGVKSGLIPPVSKSLRGLCFENWTLVDKKMRLFGWDILLMGRKDLAFTGVLH